MDVAGQGEDGRVGAEVQDYQQALVLPGPGEGVDLLVGLAQQIVPAVDDGGVFPAQTDER